MAATRATSFVYDAIKKKKDAVKSHGLVGAHTSGGARMSKDESIVSFHDRNTNAAGDLVSLRGVVVNPFANQGCFCLS